MVSGSVCFLTVLCLLRLAFLELQNLRVEIVPDGQTSFVGKTTAEPVIAESDCGRASGPPMRGGPLDAQVKGRVAGSGRRELTWRRWFSGYRLHR